MGWGWRAKGRPSARQLEPATRNTRSRGLLRLPTGVRNSKEQGETDLEGVEARLLVSLALLVLRLPLLQLPLRQVMHPSLLLRMHATMLLTRTHADTHASMPTRSDDPDKGRADDGRQA